MKIKQKEKITMMELCNILHMFLNPDPVLKISSAYKRSVLGPWSFFLTGNRDDLQVCGIVGAVR